MEHSLHVLTGLHDEMKRLTEELTYDSSAIKHSTDAMADLLQEMNH